MRRGSAESATPDRYPWPRFVMTKSHGLPCPMPRYLHHATVVRCKLSTHQGGPVPRAMPYPPPHPQGGTPSPPPHYELPYFLGLCGVGVGRSVVSVVAARLEGQLPPAFRRPFRAVVVGLRLRRRAWLVASIALIQVRATFPSVGGPTPYQLPDLDDVHSCFLFAVSTLDLRSSAVHTTVGRSGNEGRSPFPATRSPTLPTEGATTASTTLYAASQREGSSSVTS